MSGYLFTTPGRFPTLLRVARADETYLGTIQEREDGWHILLNGTMPVPNGESVRFPTKEAAAERLDEQLRDLEGAA